MNKDIIICNQDDLNCRSNQKIIKMISFDLLKTLDGIYFFSL